MKYLFFYIIILCLLAVLVTCYKTYSALHSIVFNNLDTVEEKVHSEYFYGKCASKYKDLVWRDHLTYDDIKGKIIVKGYLNSTGKPITCIYLRSESTYADMIKYRPTRFTMCLSKIQYHYLGMKYTYYFYEWFLPVQMRPGVDWDLFFYHS